VQVTVLRLGWDPTASSPSLIDRLFRRREAARRIPPPEPPPASIAPDGEPPAAIVPDETASEQPAETTPASSDQSVASTP